MLDTQIVELTGRHFLISQMLAGHVEVAQPVRDRGIDLIAYLDRAGDTPQFLACPIQLKANRGARFMLDQKYSSISNLLMVYVWHVDEPARTEVYALTYAEAFGLLKESGHTATSSWLTNGLYTLAVNASWRSMLQRYRMTPDKWPERIRTLGVRVGQSG